MPQTSAPSSFRRAAVMLCAGLPLLLAPALARAQGTPEQQQACAPDAVKLCSDTIPDIPKTTACMKAHVADLSPRCRTAFFAATGGGTSATATAERRRAHVATRMSRRADIDRGRPAALPEREPVAAAPVAAAPAPATYAASTAPAYGAVGLGGLGNSRANLASMCRMGLIDAFTCTHTIPAMGLGE